MTPAGVMRAIRSVSGSVNHSLPSGPAVIEDRSSIVAPGSANVVIGAGTVAAPAGGGGADDGQWGGQEDEGRSGMSEAHGPILGEPAAAGIRSTTERAGLRRPDCEPEARNRPAPWPVANAEWLIRQPTGDDRCGWRAGGRPCQAGRTTPPSR